MTSAKCIDTFTVKNEKGLHTRPATELVKLLSKFDAQVTLTHNNYSVNGKSLLGILMLAASRGTKIKIEAEGIEAEKAVEALKELSLNKFNTSY